MMNSLFLRFALLLVLGFVSAAGQAAYDEDDDDPSLQRWKETALALPPYPEDRNLIEVYVGPTNTNHFFVDGNSISVTPDGVVRFTLVVKMAGGASNVTYEGVRCETRETRLFAVGRNGNSWYVSPRSEWKPVENRLVNQHHAALLRNYFCANGIIVSPEEGVRILKRGGFSPSSTY